MNNKSLINQLTSPQEQDWAIVHPISLECVDCMEGNGGSSMTTEDAERWIIARATEYLRKART